MYQEYFAISPSVLFWDRYSKWYDLWIKHNSFHQQVMEILFRIVEPNFKILDIGAGNGVLAIPLISVGCDVTVIEPSDNMRALLYKEAQTKGIQLLSVDSRRFEDIPVLTYQNYDLVIACNCVHLMDMSTEMVLDRIFSLDAKVVCIVSELNVIKNKVKVNLPNYEMKLLRVFYADTSFAYHSLKEAFEHFEFVKMRTLSSSERNQIYKELVFEKGHFWHRSKELFGIYIWYRK